jgi:hypothetical protein
MQLLLAGVAAGDADADRTRGVGRSDVVRSVANYKHSLGVKRRAENFSGPVDCLARQFATVGRVGAIAAEREEAVEVGAGELDVRGRFDCSGRDPQQEAGFADPREQVFDAGQDL